MNIIIDIIIVIFIIIRTHHIVLNKILSTPQEFDIFYLLIPLKFSILGPNLINGVK